MLVAIWRSELAVIIDGDHAMAHPGSDAVQEAWCKCEKDDGECIVTLRNYTTDQNDNPSSEPSDAGEFHKVTKALQDLIVPEQL